MPRPHPNRRRLNRTALRGLDAVFWIAFALAVCVGGPAAIGGLPRLGEAVLPAVVFEAQAGVGRGIVTLPLFRSVKSASSQGEQHLRRLPAVAIVIDDMGGELIQSRRAIALPRGVSLSFLPGPPYTALLAREARAAGHEILAHVPMEAPEGTSAMALRTDLTPEENIRRLDWALMRVRGYSGINNHEGSAFTSDALALTGVAEALYGRGIYFLDSRTTPNSEVVRVSRAFGVRSAARDVFLDDDNSPEAIARQLRLLEQTARENGVAIAIGHPRPATLDALARWHPVLRLVPVSEAIRLKTAHEWRLAVR